MPFSSSTSSLFGRPRCGLFSSTPDDSDLLLCGEDAGSFSDDDHLVPPMLLLPSGMKSSAGSDDDGDEEDDDEEVAAMWAAAETDYSPGLGYRKRFDTRSGRLEAAARRRSVAWILKVRQFYQFRPVTAYLAVNYMDRFISCHSLPQPGGWPVQLMAVACLSLAAKMEETFVPPLLDLQVEEARYVFEPRTIQRMELLVLDALDWRLRAVTPFAFLGFFACKADPGRSRTRRLVARAARIILATVQEIEFLDQCPSVLAAAAVACAASEAPALSSATPESAASWCAGLTREGLMKCYQLMQELVIDGGGKQPPRHESSPQQRAKPPPSSSIAWEVYYPSASSSSSSPSSRKRRKISSSHWVEDSKELKEP